MKILRGIASGQVLQRLDSHGAEARISGNCSGSGPVLATISSKKGIIKTWKKRRVGTASKSGFKALLRGIPKGGPYRLELACGKESVRIPEFYVGDVWILAGQSNMQGYGNLSTAPKPHPMVRAFSMRREWRQAVEPTCLLQESPDFCHHGGRQISEAEGRILRKNLGKGVGPGLPFGEEMWKRSRVPQGLICTAHGGTSMTQWSPQRVIDGNVSLYGSMLDSVDATGQPVAGMLWYQGESDTTVETAPLYTGKMQKLVKVLRKDLKQPALPWIMVQIGRVVREANHQTDEAWKSVQEQQRLLPGVIKNLAVVAAVDLSLDDLIHISSEGQYRLGLRLAREADRLVLSNRRELMPPQLRSISFPKVPRRDPALPHPVVEVVFDKVEGGLRASGEPQGFTMVDEKGRDLRAIFRTTLHGNVVRLHLRAAMVDAKLCYGDGVAPVCNITDSRDHSLPVFSPKFLGQARAYLPFVKEWNVTAPGEPREPLDRMEAPEVKSLGSEVRTYLGNEYGFEGFINEHARWVGQKGRGYFEASLELAEPMRLDVLMGYDGPFRLWFNRKSFFTDSKGMNPCFPDKASKSISLPAGKHSIQVAMDLVHGASWGFFLRFIRKDLRPKQIEARDYARPVYGV